MLPQFPPLWHLCVKHLPSSGATSLSNLAWTGTLSFQQGPASEATATCTRGREQAVLRDVN